MINEMKTKLVLLLFSGCQRPAHQEPKLSDSFAKGSVQAGMRMFAKLSRLAVLLALLLTIASAVTSDQTEKIIVVSVTGKWIPQPPLDAAHPDKALEWGQSLDPKGCVWGPDGGFIVLAVALYSDISKDRPFPFPCEKGKTSPSPDCPIPPGQQDRICGVSLKPEKWKSGNSALDRIWAVVRPLFTNGPEKYMVAVSRGVEEELVDAVVPIQGNRGDLSAAFREMDSGHYWVRLTPVNGSSPPSAPLELQFRRGAPASVTFNSLTPELYKVLIVDQAGQPAGSDCWVLATAPEDYSSVSAHFERAREESSKWPEAMDPSAVRALLRAYLESLGSARPGSRQ